MVMVIDCGDDGDKRSVIEPGPTTRQLPLDRSHRSELGAVGLYQRLGRGDVVVRAHQHRLGCACAVDETSVILLHPPLPLVGVSVVMERERQQNDSLFNG